MPEWLKHILEAIKYLPRYFLPIFLASGFVLFAPTTAIDFLNIVEWRNQANPYLGIAFLFSGAAVACEWVRLAMRWAINKYVEFRRSRSAIAGLKNLSADEKSLLAWYLTNDTKTALVDRESGVAAGLVYKGILYPAVSYADIYSFPVNLRDWAWDYLKEHPDVLTGVKPRLPKRRNSHI